MMRGPGRCLPASARGGSCRAAEPMGQHFLFSSIFGLKHFLFSSKIALKHFLFCENA